MKKFLLCIALFGMMAVPAWADITPGDRAQMSLVPLASNAGTGLRDSPYNGGAFEWYDNLASQAGGEGPPVEWVTGYVASSWLFDDVHATTLNTTFTHQHLVLQGTDIGALGNTTRSQVIGYFNNPGGTDTSNGGPLLTTGGNPAIFVYNLSVFTINPATGNVFAQSWILTHPAVIIPAGGDLYAGWLSSDLSGVWGTGQPNQSTGTSHLGADPPGQAFTSGIFRPGAAFGTASGGPPLGGPFTSGTTGNVTFSIGFVPEPATIGVLALGGLLALRRRRS